MPSLLARLKNIVWTALLALIASWLTLVAALTNADLKLVIGLGAYSIAMSIIAPKSPQTEYIQNILSKQCLEWQQGQTAPALVFLAR